MLGCTFCELTRAGLPQHGIYEDASFLVLLDRESLGFGHSLVIPKPHAQQLIDLEPDLYAACFALARVIASELQVATESTAVAFVAFGSGLPHAHLHLVPHSDPEILLRPTAHVRHVSQKGLRAQAEILRAHLAQAFHTTRGAGSSA